MQKQPMRRPKNGAKAIALDPKELWASYRFWLITTILMAAASIPGFYLLFFGR